MSRLVVPKQQHVIFRQDELHVSLVNPVTFLRTPQALPSKSSRGALADAPVPSGYYAVYHSAVGCAGPGANCLHATSGVHGCRVVTSGGATQCVWDGEDAAAAACTAWPQCAAFWCGAATDIPTSNGSWCWARGAADVIHGGAFQNATSFIKTSLPQAVELKCTSGGCTWVWASGEVCRFV